MTTTAQYREARQSFFNAEDAYIKLVARCVECEFDRTPEFSPSSEAVEAARTRAEGLAITLRQNAAKLSATHRKEAEYILGKNGF